ncbi:hypothetical protein [Pedobacter sp. MC2016-24]|uniref:hypothetical protein n=1 Tax=Pedobacter sp. MC2016-24 TaxID=2780090 RepID=UPI0018816C26|nr:hypothetical protein [Pedobacter sp. MC2016-24]MBE9598877.1 hypothetical protein [Pedobacter sp. MC2016-24]
MKKLANVSPFLLLLIPVFMMMLLTFVTSHNANQDDDFATKPSGSKTSYIKISNPFK